MKWIPQLIIIVLSALLAYLQKHSIAITYSSEIEGSSCCFFCDSFGNRFELMEYEVSETNT